MATADLSHVSNENTNFSRLCKLLVDGGTRVLREVFDNIHPPTSLKSHLLDPANHKILKTLKYKKVLYKEQWDKLYPAGGSTVTSRGFDITLLCLLLRNICHLKPPSAACWHTLPLPTSTNTEDDVVRIKLYRNELYGHIKEATMSDSDFTNYWNNIKVVLVRLGGTHYQAQIEKLRIESMDPGDGKYAIQCLEEWFKSDEEIMEALGKLAKTQHEEAEKTRQTQHEEAEKTRQTQHEEAEKTRHELAKKMDESQQQSAEKTDGKLDELKHQLSEIDARQQELMKGHVMSHASKKGKLPDIGLCSKRLKSSTKSQTESQPKLMAIDSVSRARTDEIFTNLTIQRGRKGVQNRNNASRSEHLDDYSLPDQTPIKTCQEIFNRPEKDTSNPKSILVVGKPGIGKSLFCQKLVRDWANDILLQNEFDFVYLLPFRQLNRLGKRTKELNLCEVLNRSPLLDQSSSIDESLFKYMNEHQEQVLFILDGYDEYANRKEIFKSFEEEYVNNPGIRMPVSALVSKLMKKKIFSDATVMVTSRPREADELGGIDFDAMVEILGFSPLQVEEFIVKYFQSIKHEEFTNVVSKHIMKSPDLLSVAHIPMLCFLICWCLDWNIEFKKENNLPVNEITEDIPVTITDLYSEVVRIFEIKHHSKSEYRTTELPHQFEIPPVVENTLEKLSKLAARTMKEKQFIFQESDLKKFGIQFQEVELLTASGFLTCGPGLRETPFTITRDICFSHLSFHEYFAAFEFVRNKEMPSNIESSMVFQFMAGVMAKEKNEELMEQLIEVVCSKEPRDILLTAKCLHEYQDEAFGVRMIKKHHRRFCNDGQIYCDVAQTEVDCVAVSFFLNLISEFCNKENVEAQEQPALSSQSFIATGFDFNIETSEGAKRIYDSLKRESCPITSLSLRVKDDKGLQYLSQALPSTKITTLHIGGYKITDVALQYLSQALPYTKITELGISNNDITDVGVRYLSQALPSTKITTLIINGDTNITDVGVQYLSTISSTKISILYLKHGKKTRVLLNY